MHHANGMPVSISNGTHNFNALLPWIGDRNSEFRNLCYVDLNYSDGKNLNCVGIMNVLYEIGETNQTNVYMT